MLDFGHRVPLFVVCFNFCCLLPQIVNSLSIDFRRNACKKYSDYPTWYINSNCYYNPDVLSDVPTMIRRNGYPFEGHSVTTEDGQILQIFRIPSKNRKNAHHQPVFLVHGLLTTASVWVDVGNRSLAFVLAERGYDVWLGSIRGTLYGMKHQKYTETDPEFWNYNLDTLSQYDIREQIKFVAKRTGKQDSSIIYIGHSMGTTVSFMYASDNIKEAENYLAGIISMAPVVYVSKKQVMMDVRDITPNIERLLEGHNYTALLEHPYYNKINNYLCPLFPYYCKYGLDAMFGNLSYHMQAEDLLLLTGYFPSGTSVHVLKQYKQIVARESLSKFDYGKEKNLEIYKQPDPPKYDLTQIKLPMYFFYGENDPLLSRETMERTFAEFGSVRKELIHIPRDNTKIPYTHLDFIYAVDMEQYLYPELLNKLKMLKK